MKLPVDASPRARTAGPGGPAVCAQAAGVSRPGFRALAAALPVLAGATLFAACHADRGTDAAPGSTELTRVRVAAREIPLDFDVDPDRLEFSSLTWWGDRLVLLPQQPHEVDPGASPHWYILEREAIDRHLHGADPRALRPRRLPFDGGGTTETIEGWDGLEALAVQRDRVIVSVERVRKGRWGSVLVGGTLSESPLNVRLDATRLVEIDGDSGQYNFSEEALVATPDGILTLHELNGRIVNPLRRARRLDWELVEHGWVTMPVIEYRITDATDVDADGRFWVTNQYWPPEAPLVLPVRDALAEQRREAGVAVERIVGLRLHEGAVQIDPAQGVVEIELLADGVVRNWEGLVRWDDTGFLVVTDRYPRTILAFVPRR